MAVLPLNWDVFTSMVVGLVNTPVFTNFPGTLDGIGEGSAQFDLPPGSGGPGIVLYFPESMKALRAREFDILLNHGFSTFPLIIYEQ